MRKKSIRCDFHAKDIKFLSAAYTKTENIFQLSPFQTSVLFEQTEAETTQPCLTIEYCEAQNSKILKVYIVWEESASKNNFA